MVNRIEKIFCGEYKKPFMVNIKNTNSVRVLKGRRQ